MKTSSRVTFLLTLPLANALESTVGRLALTPSNPRVTAGPFPGDPFCLDFNSQWELTVKSISELEISLLHFFTETHAAVYEEHDALVLSRTLQTALL